MIFPDGLIKEGYFEMNIYKSPNPPPPQKEASPSQIENMRSTRASSNFYGGPNPNASFLKLQ